MPRRLGFLMQSVVPLKFYPTNENVLLMTYHWSRLALFLSSIDITLYNDVMPDQIKDLQQVVQILKKVLMWGFNFLGKLGRFKQFFKVLESTCPVLV